MNEIGRIGGIRIAKTRSVARGRLGKDRGAFKSGNH